MRIYGHRGAMCIAPENTIESFKEALDRGCRYIEIDVHLTADDQVAVIHNYDTEAACGEKLVIREATMAQLKELDVVYNFGDKFKGIKIPTLEEVYEFMQNYPEVELLVETKGDAVGAPLLERVVEITRRFRMTHRVIFSTARSTTFNWFRDNHPDLPISMLPQDLDDTDITNALICQCSVAVQPYFRAVDEEYVKKAHAHNLMVIPWTVNDGETAEKLMKLGVDGVISNCPDVIIAYMKNK